ncbi:hypothetical protein HW555_013184 [Spodoptera exigua]|uniref:Uncharacterized protein n=1 Tax=Spodoptera exigua TaxID=7107 RepID=A0A835G4J0_SPOEX|nr:hypothetical protein HW555_013184 [Spodoptera exigua]
MGPVLDALSVTTLKLTCGHCNVMKRESKGCAAIQDEACETPQLLLERLKPKHMVIQQPSGCWHPVLRP